MTARTVRLKLNYNLDPSDSETLIEAVKSNAFNIEFGIFQDSIPYDLSGLTSVTMVIRPARGTATNLAAITLPVASLTALPNSVRWNRGTMQHGIFEWTTAQMNQTVTGDYDDYWWSCYALLTTNEEVTLGNGIFRIYESNIANGGVPPVNPGATITADEADARYVRFDAATSLTGGQQTQARENIDADNAANLTSGIIPDARMPNLTGDITTVEGAVATTLATVNSNVGSFGSATQASAITVNAKGLVTAASAITVTPAESSLTFTDITTNNATSLKHGFLPKLSGSASDVLKGDGTWAVESAGSGSVTSVAMSVPSILAVAGSPITTSGTLAVTLATQSANVVFAGPTSGGAATPTFRSIVDADLPTGIAVNKLAALTASRLVVSDASGFISASSVTSTEAGYLSGVTSALQTQLDAKLSTATAASTYLTVANPNATGEFTIADTAISFNSWQLTPGSRYFKFAEGGGGFGMQFNIATLTADRSIIWPNAAGTVALSASGNIALSAAGNITFTGTLPVANGGTGITALGTGVATALGINVGTAGAFVVNGGALGTPSSGALTSCTGLPISTGVSGLGSNVATFLATPTIANLNSAVSDADLAILGANTFVAAQMIDGSADAIQLLVQGHSSQTSDIFVVENSGGTNGLAVASNGSVNVGGGAAVPFSITSNTATVTFTGTGDGSLLQSHSLILPANGYARFGFTGGTDPILTASASNLTLTQANFVLDEALNIVVGTTTGTKIGTATGQKIGFWNATPVVQQVLATGGGATVDNVITFLQTVGLCKQS